MLMQKVSPGFELQGIDFQAEFQVDFGFCESADHLSWIHSVVVPIPLHIAIFGARRAANHQHWLLAFDLPPDSGPDLGIGQIEALS